MTHRLTLTLATLITLAVASPVLAQQDARGLSKMQLTRDQPIAIDADRLEVREEQGIAIFTGAVQVEQGNTSMKAGELKVFYAKGGEGSVATGSANIDRLEMRNKVIIRSQTQTATGDAGSFDMKSEVFTLTGSKVVLTEGDNVAVGCRLVVQMKTGAANLEACKGGSGTGRVQIMLNPKTARGN